MNTIITLIFKACWGFISRFKIYFYAAILAATFYSGWTLNDWYWKGKHNKVLLQYSEAVIKARDNLRDYENERLERLQEVERHGATKLHLLNEKGKIHQTEVIRYVTNPDTVSCELDVSWVYHHNAAATGAEPVTEATRTPNVGAIGASNSEAGR